MIRKHNRRAAKAAFSIAFGVALILGGTTAASAAGGDATSTARKQATPIIVGTKNFPEQYILGQLYKQALEAQGFKVGYKENIASTELIDTSLRSGKITLYPEYTGIMLSVTFKRKTLPGTAAATYAARETVVRPTRADPARPDALPGRRRPRGHARDRQQVRLEDDSST